VYDRTDEEYENKLRRMIATADFMRKQLLQRLPPQEALLFDKTEAQQFVQALKCPMALNRNDAASYLQQLAKTRAAAEMRGKAEVVPQEMRRKDEGQGCSQPRGIGVALPQSTIPCPAPSWRGGREAIFPDGYFDGLSTLYTAYLERFISRLPDCCL